MGQGGERAIHWFEVWSDDSEVCLLSSWSTGTYRGEVILNCVQLIITKQLGRSACPRDDRVEVRRNSPRVGVFCSKLMIL